MLRRLPGGESRGPAMGCGLLALLSVGIVSACRSTRLAPTGDRMVGAVGCTVVFPGPDHIDTTGIVQWDYKENKNNLSLSVVLYYVELGTVEITPSYKCRVVFNKSDWSLELKVQMGDQGLYQLKRQEEEISGKWIQLDVLEPLSKPEILWNSSLVGSTIQMVCNVRVGIVSSYQWGKDGQAIPRDGRYQLLWNNSVLHILNATQSDNGWYSCNVTNEVSQNETSRQFILSGSSAVMSDRVLMVVAVINTLILLAIVADGNLYSE